MAKALGLTKSQISSFYTEGDLAIIIYEPYPWDGKAGIYS